MYDTIPQISRKRVKPPVAVRFKELDTLRGFAALYVMFFHFSIIAGYDVGFLKAGVTGVDLFFIISGYVIFMSLEKTKKSVDFIVSRLSRLMPSYLVMMALTIFVIVVFAPAKTPSFFLVLANVTMLQPIFNAHYIDESYWTLTVELLFYTFMLFMFRVQLLNNIVKAGFITMAVIFVYCLFTSTYYPDSKFYIMPRYLFPLISHFQLFFAGILFYKMRFEKNALQNHILLAFCYLLTLFFFDKAGRAHFFIDQNFYAFIVLIYFTIFYLFISNRLSFLNVPILVFFGSISYGIYLLHQEFSIILYPYFVDDLGMEPFAAITLLFGLIIIISALVTYKIERPIIKLIRNRYVHFSPR